MSSEIEELLKEKAKIPSEKEKEQRELLEFEMFKDLLSTSKDILLENMVMNESLDKQTVLFPKLFTNLGNKISELTSAVSNLSFMNSEGMNIDDDVMEGSTSAFDAMENDEVDDIESDTFFAPVPIKSSEIVPYDDSMKFGQTVNDEKFEEARTPDAVLSSIEENTFLTTDVLVKINDTSLKSYNQLDDISLSLRRITDSENSMLEIMNNKDDQGTVGGLNKKDDKDKDKEAGGFENLGFLGEFFKKGSKVGKLLGTVAKFASILTASYAFLDGFFNDDTLKEITGDTKDNLSFFERTLAGFSNIVDMFTFGLVSGSDVFKTLTGITDWISENWKDIVFPFFSTFKELFNEETGPLGFITTGIKDVLNDPVVQEVITVFQETFEAVFGAVEKIRDFVADGLGYITEKLSFGLIDKDTSSSAIKAVSDIFNPLKTKENLESVGTTVTDFFAKPKDRKGVLKDVENFEKDLLTTKKVEPTKESIATDFTKEKDNTLNRTVKGNEVSKSLYIEKPVTKNISPITEESRKGVEVSKRRMEAKEHLKNKEPQIVPIPMQAPVQTKKSIDRSSSHPDLSLALLNNGMLEI